MSESSSHRLHLTQTEEFDKEFARCNMRTGSFLLSIVVLGGLLGLLLIPTAAPGINSGVDGLTTAVGPIPGVTSPMNLLLARHDDPPPHKRNDDPPPHG